MVRIEQGELLLLRSILAEMVDGGRTGSLNILRVVNKSIYPLF